AIRAGLTPCLKQCQAGPATYPTVLSTPHRYVAVGAGCDGQARRNACARPLDRLAPRFTSDSRKHISVWEKVSYSGPTLATIRVWSECLVTVAESRAASWGNCCFCTLLVTVRGNWSTKNTRRGILKLAMRPRHRSMPSGSDSCALASAMTKATGTSLRRE